MSNQVKAKSKDIKGSVEATLSFLNTHKLATNKPILPPNTSSHTLSSKNSKANLNVDDEEGSEDKNSTESGPQKAWIQPSGPRRQGEGVENEEQGIVAADRNPLNGTVLVRITLLAAGFIIGPSGSSVRDITRSSGCEIKSWTEQPGPNTKSRRPCRVFVLEGHDSSIVTALAIISAAVDRYKALCEGSCSGQSVNRAQKIMGVDFSYQPPPKSVVPFAAALKGLHLRPGQAGYDRECGRGPAGRGDNKSDMPDASNYPSQQEQYILQQQQQVAAMAAMASLMMSPSHPGFYLPNPSGLPPQPSYHSPVRAHGGNGNGSGHAMTPMAPSPWHLQAHVNSMTNSPVQSIPSPVPYPPTHMPYSLWSDTSTPSVPLSSTTLSSNLTSTGEPSVNKGGQSNEIEVQGGAGSMSQQQASNHNYAGGLMYSPGPQMMGPWYPSGGLYPGSPMNSGLGPPPPPSPTFSSPTHAPSYLQGGPQGMLYGLNLGSPGGPAAYQMGLGGHGGFVYDQSMNSPFAYSTPMSPAHSQVYPSTWGSGVTGWGSTGGKHQQYSVDHQQQYGPGSGQGSNSGWADGGNPRRKYNQTSTPPPFTAPQQKIDPSFPLQGVSKPSASASSATTGQPLREQKQRKKSRENVLGGREDRWESSEEEGEDFRTPAMNLAQPPPLARTPKRPLPALGLPSLNPSGAFASSNQQRKAIELSRMGGLQLGGGGAQDDFFIFSPPKSSHSHVTRNPSAAGMVMGQHEDHEVYQPPHGRRHPSFDGVLPPLAQFKMPMPFPVPSPAPHTSASTPSTVASSNPSSLSAGAHAALRALSGLQIGQVPAPRQPDFGASPAQAERRGPVSSATRESQARSHK